MRLWIRIFAITFLFTIPLGCTSNTSSTRVVFSDTPGLPERSTQLPPTDTESPSAVPLTREGIISCPVTLPNGKFPAQGVDFNLGNEADTLFTIPWPGGKLIFSPNGPGFRYADGSLEMKWPWYRTVPGDLLITGERLDAKAPPMPTITLRGSQDGYGETGFHPSGLLFPSEGCWKVTAQVGAESLTFVTLVVKVPFDMMWAGWLPDGLIYADTDLTNLPGSMGVIYKSSGADSGELVIETLREDLDRYPEKAQQTFMINGQPGICVQGNWDKNQQWQVKLNAGRLEWRVGELLYRVRHTGLGLACKDLLKIAESLTFN